MPNIKSLKDQWIVRNAVSGCRQLSGLSKVEISENTGLILTRGGFDMC